MTFLEQQSKLSRILGDSNTTTDDQWPLADRQFELNRGEMRFAVDTKSLLRREDGTVTSKKIALPTGFLGVHILVVNNITMTSENEMPLADYGRYINSGEDQYYFWVDSSSSTTRAINFIATSTEGKAGILFYYGKPTSDLSADTDESPFEDEYREASVYYAASQLLPQAGKTELASYYKNEYENLVARATYETENKVKSVIKAVPDILRETVYDADIQGIGEQIGGSIW